MGGSSRRDFRLFWLAGAADQLGSHASGLILPLLVLAVGGSAVHAGLIGTVAALGQFGIAPLAGVYADRYSRRAMLTWSALVASAAMGTVVVGVAIDRISWPALLVAGLVEGVAAGCYSAANSGATRRVLPADRPESAVATLQAREQGTQLVGPSVGGFLYQVAALAPFLFDAVSYLVAAILVRRIRTDLGPDRSGDDRPAVRSMWSDLVAGVRFVWSQPFLRFVVIWAAGVNLALTALFFHVVLVARLDGASAGSIGLILTLSGAAGLVGAIGAPQVIARVRASRLVAAASWLLAVAVIPLALATSTWQFGLLLMAVSLVSPTLSVIFQTKAIMVTPDAMQSRVGTVLGTISEGAAAFAPLLAGLLVGAATGATIAVVFGAGLALLAWYATANRHHLRSAPAGPTDPDPEAVPAEKGG